MVDIHTCTYTIPIRLCIHADSRPQECKCPPVAVWRPSIIVFRKKIISCLVYPFCHYINHFVIVGRSAFCKSAMLLILFGIFTPTFQQTCQIKVLRCLVSHIQCSLSPAMPFSIYSAQIINRSFFNRFDFLICHYYPLFHSQFAVTPGSGKQPFSITSRITDCRRCISIGFATC